MAMEIGPIPGIRALGVVEARRKILEPPAIFDIDGSAKPGDGAVERTGRKAAGAEGEEDDLNSEEGGERGEEDPQKSVDYFA
jgi:hypothetical protein